MEDMCELVREMMDEIDLYRKKEFDSFPDMYYRELCGYAGNLFEKLGERGITHEEIERNGEDFRHFLKSLQIMSDQFMIQELDKELVEIAYEESLRHAGGVLGELAFFCRNRENED